MVRSTPLAGFFETFILSFCVTPSALADTVTFPDLCVVRLFNSSKLATLSSLDLYKTDTVDVLSRPALSITVADRSVIVFVNNFLGD